MCRPFWIKDRVPWCMANGSIGPIGARQNSYLIHKYTIQNNNLLYIGSNGSVFLGISLDFYSGARAYIFCILTLSYPPCRN